jgi:hypothetical protein
VLTAKTKNQIYSMLIGATVSGFTSYEGGSFLVAIIVGSIAGFLVGLFWFKDESLKKKQHRASQREDGA